ncbi:MAG: hypothetical protein JWP35_3545 [Caulobacter sp.]|nr:hypothetical protein [Caulobacter sp.]
MSKLSITPAFSHTLLHPVTITLRGPKGERSEEITTVDLRRVKGKDLRAIGGITDEAEVTLTLVARLSGLDDHQVDELDAADIEVLGRQIEAFLKSGQKTGRRPSRP